MIRTMLLCAAAAMTACGSSSTEPTREQARELDRADQMLDEAPDRFEQVDDAGLAANGSGEPADDR